MYKTLIILIHIALLSSNAHAIDYDPLLMRAQATIFPKIILLDKDLDSKLEKNKIVIEILHSDEERKVALTIKSLIENKYKDKLGNKSLIIQLNDFESFNTKSNVTAYFILKGSSDIHNKITAHASTNKRLVFCYDHTDFKSNTLISLLMKEKTYIYLNKSAIHNYDINFLPLFYKIVKVIEWRTFLYLLK